MNVRIGIKAAPKEEFVIGYVLLTYKVCMVEIKKVLKNYPLGREICVVAASCLPRLKKRLRNILLLVSLNIFKFSFDSCLADTWGERLAILRLMSNWFVKYVEFEATSNNHALILIIIANHAYYGRIIQPA